MSTCPHTERLIPLLHDSELEGPLRREAVSHLSTCIVCSRTFSLLERERELLGQMIDEQVEAIDFSGFWSGVTSKLQEPRPPWSVRIRLWYESWKPAWSFPLPAWTTTTALLLFAAIYFLSYFPSQFSSPLPEEESLVQNDPPLSESSLLPESLGPVPIATTLVDNQAQIESLSASDMVAIWNDPESNFTFIWVGDEVSEELP